MTSVTSALIGKELGIFAVDPGTSSSAPHITVTAVPGDVWNAFYSTLDKGKADPLTSISQTATTKPLVFTFPVVENDTFMEVTVTTGSQPLENDFRWRTLVRPDGKKLMDYKGQKKLLPPDDFDEFWNRAKKELDTVEAKPRVVRQSDKDTSTGLLFRVELDSVEETTIVGWYFVPRTGYKNGNPEEGVKKKFPAVIITPGYGAEEPPIDRTKLGYITFSTNPRNHGPSKAYWKAPGEHLIYNITDPEKYYYKLALLDCLQAARFVLGREEVDPKRVGTEGGSQGGLFAVGTAMLEPRIKCVAANVIAFTDYADGMELASSGGQTQIRQMLAEEGTTASLIEKSISYADGANLISRVKVPVQICMGGVDPVCPYICGIVAYNRIPKGVEKEFHIVPSAAHEVPREMRQWNLDWFKKWLKPEPEEAAQQQR